MIKKLLLSFAFVALLIFTSQAQGINRDHFFIGAGPSMIYGDNAGHYRKFRFKVLPTLSFGYNYQLSTRWDIRATVGSQWVDSGDYYKGGAGTVNRIIEAEQAYNFSGQIVYGDIMPTFQLNPNMPGRVGNVVNFYAGTGLGALLSTRNDQFLVDNSEENMVFNEENNSSTALYIPVRLGMSTNLEHEWDLAFELTSLFATNSNLDGNHLQIKRLNTDALLQFQIIIRRYMGRY